MPTKKHDDLQTDIQKRFNQEKKYVTDASDEKPRGRGFMLAASIIMLVIVVISMLSTFVSFLK
ncbi:hypothetical protein M3M35_04275 [Fructilactobacillus myrtifloralis]|uniref:DUF4044 domain-containing protein n=1 Tax=Fructilactobacillus myrtifloralis TaxID=2940301 RepID=A0ABY5BMV2_9LACO|nr:hypothetical protein [Fructilactobacillus myrtifloralis]USS84541.1 hypothetical protein M3M35_04275 [Fructilactobacillus myrtifloralis]